MSEEQTPFSQSLLVGRCQSTWNHFVATLTTVFAECVGGHVGDTVGFHGFQHKLTRVLISWHFTQQLLRATTDETMMHLSLKMVLHLIWALLLEHFCMTCNWNDGWIKTDSCMAHKNIWCTCAEFFKVWSHLASSVYAVAVTDVPELQQRVEDGCELIWNIPPVILKLVWGSIMQCAVHCVIAQGQY